MAKVPLSLNKSVEENASLYFEQAKKARKKLEGAKRALDISRMKLEAEQRASQEKERNAEEKRKIAPSRKKEWYEKFRWFKSSDGFLVIGGRDAATNEIVIKKHTDKNDLVFHTEMAGSPFVVAKLEGKEISETMRTEAATFTAVHSRAWKLQMGRAEVFYVRPEQVTKQAKAGEYLDKGAFIIKGETTHLFPGFSFAIGIFEGKAMGGPLSAVKKHCAEYLEIEPGEEKPSDVAKAVKRKIGGDLDEIIRALPSGCRVKKVR
ncbi:MAG: NFACT RNA binding domain-containing protein [Nanoarchaeota archaeon]